MYGAYLGVCRLRFRGAPGDCGPLRVDTEIQRFLWSFEYTYIYIFPPLNHVRQLYWETLTVAQIGV